MRCSEPGHRVTVAIEASRGPGRWAWVVRRHRTMIVIGYILLAVGCIAGLVGQVMLLTVAYRRSLGWFLACLFIPLFELALLCVQFGLTYRPFGIAIAGLLIACLGGWMAGVPV